MTRRSELRIHRTAYPAVTREMRHALTAFLAELGYDEDARDDIRTAVGEAVANAVEHAYDGTELGDIELFARTADDGRTLSVDVFDRGTFLRRERRPGRGFGFRIVQSIARSVSIDVDNGTHVHLVFDIERRRDRLRSQ